MSYSYYFEFFKPGKKSYTSEEVKQLLSLLNANEYEIEGRLGTRHFEVKSGRPNINIKSRETKLDLELRKNNHFLDLILSPAEKKGGMIGLLSISDFEVQENPSQNGWLFRTAAEIITSVLKPYFAWGDHELELNKLQPFLDFERIGALAWANFFSEQFIRKLGSVDKVLLHNSTKHLVENTLHNHGYAPLILGENPVEPLRAIVALECDRRWPGAILKSFEIPPLRAIEAE